MWLYSISIFQPFYFYLVLQCLAIYFQCYAFHGTSLEHVWWNKQTGTTIEQFNGILRDPVFIWKLIFFNSCIDPILYWKSRNHRNAILLNLKIFLCAWWPIFYFFFFLFFCNHKRQSIIQNLFQKLNIFKTERSSSEIWDCQWHKTSSVTPVFISLILLLLFQIIKKCQCCGFTFTNFFFFLTATNVLAASWVTLSKTRIIVCFYSFFIWFSRRSLMEINPTHVYFRSRMLCFDDEEQKDKTYSKTKASQNILCINAIVCY